MSKRKKTFPVPLFFRVLYPRARSDRAQSVSEGLSEGRSYSFIAGDEAALRTGLDAADRAERLRFLPAGTTDLDEFFRTQMHRLREGLEQREAAAKTYEAYNDAKAWFSGRVFDLEMQVNPVLGGEVAFVTHEGAWRLSELVSEEKVVSALYRMLPSSFPKETAQGVEALDRYVASAQVPFDFAVRAEEQIQNGLPAMFSQRGRLFSFVLGEGAVQRGSL